MSVLTITLTKEHLEATKAIWTRPDFEDSLTSTTCPIAIELRKNRGLDIQVGGEFLYYSSRVDDEVVLPPEVDAFISNIDTLVHTNQKNQSPDAWEMAARLFPFTFEVEIPDSWKPTLEVPSKEKQG